MTILKFVCAQSFRIFWWQANQSGLLQFFFFFLKTQIKKLWDVPKLIRLINMTIGIEVLVKFKAKIGDKQGYKWKS
jgi:hypothetical protein